MRRTGIAARIRLAAGNVSTSDRERDPRIEELAAEAPSLARELARISKDTKDVESVRKDAAAKLKELGEDFTSVRQQLELGSTGRVMMQLLFDLDIRCMRAGGELDALPVPALDRTRLAAIRVRDRLSRHASLNEVLGVEDDTALSELLDARGAILGQLDRQYEVLIRALASLEQEKRQYRDELAEMRDYVARQLFGFGLKSAPTVSWETFAGVPRALGWWVAEGHGSELVGAIPKAVARTPLASLFVALVVVALLVARPRIKHSLVATGGHLGRISHDRYGKTLEALLWTILLALPVPLLVAHAGWLLKQQPEPSHWMRGLTSGIWTATAIVLPAALIAATTIREGLGPVHLGWSGRAALLVRRAVVAATMIYVPALIVTLSFSYGAASEFFDGLGRISLVLGLLGVASVMLWICFAKGGLSSGGGSPQDAVSGGRWRSAACSLLVGVPLVLTVVMLAGYLVTGIMLSLGFMATLGIVAAGFVLHGLALRWFAIQERQIALREAREKRRSSSPGAGGPNGVTNRVTDGEGDADAPVAAEPQLDLESMTGQTRKLLGIAFGLITAVAILLYWSRTFPVGDVIASVELPLIEGLTLLDVVMAVLAGVATVVLVRNLPGLIELAGLRSTRFAPGTRHAIYTLCRYAVVALGVAFVSGFLQLDWSQFGWILAALSVGLGFGLQEVVANFVCGVILLFERPIRIGDIVTIEGTTGTVTNIRMRATTITNWDQQEFVVPNKTLITNTLLNWTLSEPLNRIVVPVGVAYGSDTEGAREILLEVARDHPEILDDPQPMATFEQFGDSSLNLVLRAYLPNMEHRLQVITEVHTEIHRRFAQAGIEIAFPQLDVHLRAGTVRENAGDGPATARH